MLTRCPACATTFRITPEQLKAKLGRVRCGQCTSVFNALDSLVEETGGAGLAPHHDTERESDEAEAIHLEFDLSAAEAEIADAALESPSVVPEAEVPLHPEQSHERPERPSLPFQGGGQEGDGVPASGRDEPHSGTSIPHPHPSPPLEGEGAEAIVFPPHVEPLEPLADSDAPLEEVPAPTDDEADAEVEAEPVSQPEPESESDSSDTDVADEHPAALEADVLPPPPAFLDLIAPTRPRRWPWAIGVALALVVLVLQLALLYRVELAVMLPEAKPLLVDACRPLACQVDLPMRSELLSIDASDLHPGADKGQLQLIATLKNRAPFVQGYPNLEVTLTDLADRPLIVRSLKPADYLPKGSKAEAGFAPRGDLAVSLDLEVGDVPAVGYRLYLYYP